MRMIKKKTAIPLVIALLLVLVGTAGAFAMTSSGMLESPDYKAHFYMNHLQVHLLENGQDVCGEQNQLGDPNKVSGELVQHLGYSREGDTEKLGSVEPGKLYEEVITAQNKQEIPVFLRVTVRKYWVEANKQNGASADDQNADGEDTQAGEAAATVTAGDKIPGLSPDRIHLMYEGKAYNDEAWFLNESESTDEQTTYYYRKQLGQEETAPLFDSLVIDSSVMDKAEKEIVSEDKNEETGVTTIKYKYRFDGSAFVIKADVQAIQTHNANDAIHSQWGVYDITADGTELKPAQ